MVSYFHENLNKRIGAVVQTVYTDVYNYLRCMLLILTTEILFGKMSKLNGKLSNGVCMWVFTLLNS